MNNVRTNRLPGASKYLVNGLLVLMSAGLIGGCGGSEPKPQDVAKARAAALLAVRSYVDTDNCQLLSESYRNKEFGTLAKCQANQIKGVRKGEYEVVSVTGSADAAVVSIKRLDGSVMAITAEQQDGKWRITGKTDSGEPTTEAAIGDPLWYLAAWRDNATGKESDLRFRITVKSAKPSSPPQYYGQGDGTEFWKVRATVESESGATATADWSDFALVSASGERFESSNEFAPALGGSAGSIASGGLAPGDKFSGFITFQPPKKTKIVAVQFYSMKYSDGSVPPLKWLLKK